MKREPQVYQIVQASPRRVFGARNRIERNARDLAVETSEGLTAKHQPGAAWFTDLRRGRLNIYGGLLRFIDHLHRRGIPMETALLIPEWISEYIRETWTGSPTPDAARPIALFTTGETRKVG